MSVGSNDPQAIPPAATPVGPQATRVEVSERPAWHANGFLGLLVAIVAILVANWCLRRAGDSLPSAVAGTVLLVLAILVLASISAVAPGQTKVLQFFGSYAGTVRAPGFVWLPLLTTRRTLSVRVRNFETAKLKVNDSTGNPVDIAAIVVWQVADTARASFAVESFTAFVEVQAEAAVRHVARSYPYDGPDVVESLRGSTDVISAELAREVAARVAVAGVEILEVRISHLAYSPEIAQSMLQRQQAAAVVAARATIVEGAVTMVQMALEELSRQHIVEFDEERRAAMVSNLLVVLCGDSRVQPVVNTGTLYQ
jgi:regulator of protease activity HflC (stomatin/prohibitin superfamily)